jgi:hypothetical protein
MSAGIESRWGRTSSQTQKPARNQSIDKLRDRARRAEAEPGLVPVILRRERQFVGQQLRHDLPRM